MGQIAIGLLGLDLPADIRDLVYDITNFKLTPQHALQTILDIVALVPVIGGVKYVDEAGDLVKSAVKHGDEMTELVKTYNKIKYPGNNPQKPPSKGFEWRGKSEPSEGKGNWYNPKTGEKWNADLQHRDPIGPHWDYTDSNGKSYRVYPDGHIEKK